MSKVETLIVSSQSEMNEALAIRRAVFIEEQKVPESLEVDEHDHEPWLGSSAIHALVRVDGLAVATGRLLLESDDGAYPHIGRVAVRRESRGRGYGRAVMLALQEEARRRGFEGITLAAQLHAIGFYERLGYTVYGDVFLDAGIEHRWMDLKL